MGKLIRTEGYVGDLKLEQHVSLIYSSFDKEGIPYTLIDGTPGTPVIYEDVSNTEVTVSISSTYNINSVVGLNRLDFDVEATDGFEDGKDYTIIRHGMVVDGESLNAVIGNFSIRNRH
jgi:hypothetical protein